MGRFVPTRRQGQGIHRNLKLPEIEHEENWNTFGGNGGLWSKPGCVLAQDTEKSFRTEQLRQIEFSTEDLILDGQRQPLLA